MFKALFGLARSWQKGQQYARDALLKEERAKTERARQKQILADVRLKEARTLLIEKLTDAKGSAPAGVAMLGCDICGIYDIREDGQTHCDECGQPYTQTHIDLRS